MPQRTNLAHWPRRWRIQDSRHAFFFLRRWMLVLRIESIDFSGNARWSAKSSLDSPVLPVNEDQLNDEMQSGDVQWTLTWMAKSSSILFNSNCLSSYWSMLTKFFFRSISGSTSLNFSLGVEVLATRVGTLIWNRLYQRQEKRDFQTREAVFSPGVDWEPNVHFRFPLHCPARSISSERAPRIAPLRRILGWATSQAARRDHSTSVSRMLITADLRFRSVSSTLDRSKSLREKATVNRDRVRTAVRRTEILWVEIIVVIDKSEFVFRIVLSTRAVGWILRQPPATRSDLNLLLKLDEVRSLPVGLNIVEKHLFRDHLRVTLLGEILVHAHLQRLLSRRGNENRMDTRWEIYAKERRESAERRVSSSYDEHSLQLLLAMSLIWLLEKIFGSVNADLFADVVSPGTGLDTFCLFTPELSLSRAPDGEAALFTPDRTAGEPSWEPAPLRRWPLPVGGVAAWLGELREGFVSPDFGVSGLVGVRGALILVNFCRKGEFTVVY